jgi:hypothetical protein
MRQNKKVRDTGEDKRPPAAQEGQWMRYAGIVATGDSDSSQSIDETVYGARD